MQNTLINFWTQDDCLFKLLWLSQNQWKSIMLTQKEEEFNIKQIHYKQKLNFTVPAQREAVPLPECAWLFSWLYFRGLGSWLYCPASVFIKYWKKRNIAGKFETVSKKNGVTKILWVLCSNGVCGWNTQCEVFTPWWSSQGSCIHCWIDVVGIW